MRSASIIRYCFWWLWQGEITFQPYFVALFDYSAGVKCYNALGFERAILLMTDRIQAQHKDVRFHILRVLQAPLHLIKLELAEMLGISLGKAIWLRLCSTKV